ncbi:glycosyltransferase family 4 protein, partial [bacterium]|nr:glycosyltransferase family 4 protein [bacterium]
MDNEIIFIFQRKGIITGGGRMDSYLWGLTHKYSSKTRLIELDSLYKRLPKWLIKLFSINYLIGRAGRVMSYTVLLPKKKESIIYISSLLLNELCLYLLIAKTFFNSKIIVFVHLAEEIMNENVAGNRKKRFLKNKAIHVTNVVLTNSQYTKNKVMSFGVDERKIKIIYPILLDCPRIYKPKLKKQPTRITLLFIGTEFARKGLKTLLEALLILDRGDIFLNIAGDVNKESNLKFIKGNGELIKRLETKNKIKILGEVIDTSCKEELFVQADIFVMPSLSEGFGIVFAEAMAYSLPIIAADT